MAATRLIAMHGNKGKTIAQCLKDRTDYAKNADKTENGQYVSSYACNIDIVDKEFAASKDEYFRNTRRINPGDIIAYQIRQSFKPGEITPEEANQIGYETAMRFTKGNHAFIVATHTDKAHIHNHIIFNSTNLDCDRKFRDSWFIALALQRLSDLICLEHCLSVIIPKKPHERVKRTIYPDKQSHRDNIRNMIDDILERHPKDFDEFIKYLETYGYEIKLGKNIAIRGKDQKRFVRLNSLGKGYSEADIRQTIAGHPGEPNRNFDMLIDINRKMAQGKGKGYEHWAKLFNLKQVSAALVFLQDHNIRDYDELEKIASGNSDRFNQLSEEIKGKEKRLTEIAVLKTHIINYVKTKEVYVSYRKAGYSKKFYEEHREAIMLHKAAKNAFAELNVTKIPKVKELSAEYAGILAEKKKLYGEYRSVKKDMMDYQIAKQNIDQFLKIDAEQKEQNRNKKKYKDTDR